MLSPRPARLLSRLMDAAGWAAVGTGGVVVLSQLRRWDGPRLLASAQTLTPHIATGLVTAALLGVRRSRPVLATSAAVVGVAGLAITSPVVRPSPRPRAAAGAAGVRVGTVNLLYTNGRTVDVADLVASRDLDVVVFTEYTQAHHDVLTSHPVADRYPYRVERPGPRARGIAVYSRPPLGAVRALPTVNHGIDTVVEGPDRPFRVVAVHTPTPVYDFDEWVEDLEAIRAEAVRGDEPTLVIGDLNATYWHPSFRRILDAGFVDAHIADGRGLAASWPVGHVVPPFAQLDHALTARGIVATDVENFDVPGSDHRALAVTVLPAR